MQTINKYLDEMRYVQENLLKFIDDEGSFTDLKQIFNDTKLVKISINWLLFLYLISNI